MLDDPDKDQLVEQVAQAEHEEDPHSEVFHLRPGRQVVHKVSLDKTDPLAIQVKYCVKLPQKDVPEDPVSRSFRPVQFQVARQANLDDIVLRL